MKETLNALTYILTYTLIAVAAVAMLLTPVEMAKEYIMKYREYRTAKQNTEYDIRVWTSIAKSYDPVEEATDKGYAIARLVIYHHQLDELEKDRKNYLCS